MPAAMFQTKNFFPWTTIEPSKAEFLRKAEIQLRSEIAIQSRSILQAGRIMLEIKNMLAHGEFRLFVESVLGIHLRTAENYISAHRMFGERNSQSVSPLSARAIYRLAAPSMEANLRAEILQALDEPSPDIPEIEARILRKGAKESSDDEIRQVAPILQRIADLLESHLSEQVYNEFRALICNGLILTLAPALSDHLQRTFATHPKNCDEEVL